MPRARHEAVACGRCAGAGDDPVEPSLACWQCGGTGLRLLPPWHRSAAPRSSARSLAERAARLAARWRRAGPGTP